MDYSIIEESEGFYKWKDYIPTEVQYAKYAESNPSLIAAGHKIVDVFYAFTNARASFMFADSDDFGDLSGKDEKSRLYTKTHFLTNALLEYAICLDISWQVIWSYIHPSSLEYLMQQRYKKMEKKCRRKSVIQQLDCAISQKSEGFGKAEKLKNLMTAFDQDESTLKVRTLYNWIKHHGMIHFIGLGENFNKLGIAVNGKQAPMLCRKEYLVEEIEDLLLDYHLKFEQYFNKIIENIIPPGYLNNKMSLGGFFEALMKITETSN